MATKTYEDNKKWKNDLEKAGFSHLNGDRIICIDCGLTPRLGPGDSPTELHKGLYKDCKFVKENLREKLPRNKAETKQSSTELGDDLLEKQAGDILLYERKGQSALCTGGITHAEYHDENKKDFAGGYTDKTNNNGRDKSLRYEMEKCPIQESMTSQRDNSDACSGISNRDRYQEVYKKTQCKTCRKSLKNCAVVLVLPCSHMHCKTCAFGQQKCSCDTPITDQINTFWS